MWGGGRWGPVQAGRGGDVAGRDRRSIGASGGRGWEGPRCGGGVGDAVSPGSACMVVLAWRGRVWAVVAGWAAGLGCFGTVVAVGVGGGGAVGVFRGLGVGWRGVAEPGPWSGRCALLAGALAGPLTCFGLLGLVGVGGE